MPTFSAPRARLVVGNPSESAFDNGLAGKDILAQGAAPKPAIELRHLIVPDHNTQSLYEALESKASADELKNKLEPLRQAKRKGRRPRRGARGPSPGAVGPPRS